MPRRPSPSPHGFTLIELLAALTVLGVVILMITQITDGTARSVTYENRQINTDTEARMIFNRFSIDFARMLRRRDLDGTAFKQPAGTLPPRYRDASGEPIAFPANLQPGNDRLAFYAESRGRFPGPDQPSGADRSPVSVVAYQILPDAETGIPGLARRSIGLGWEPHSGGGWKGVAHLPQRLADLWPDLFSQAEAFRSVADQVFRMEYVYLLKPRDGEPARLSIVPWHENPAADPAADPAHASVDGFRDVAAIVVTLAILDRHGRGLVSDYAPLANALPDAVADSDGRVAGVAGVWNAIVTRAGFAAEVGIPAEAAAAIRVYERHFPLESDP